MHKDNHFWVSDQSGDVVQGAMLQGQANELVLFLMLRFTFFIVVDVVFVKYLTVVYTLAENFIRNLHIAQRSHLVRSDLVVVLGRSWLFLRRWGSKNALNNLDCCDVKLCEASVSPNDCEMTLNVYNEVSKKLRLTLS